MLVVLAGTDIGSSEERVWAAHTSASIAQALPIHDAVLIRSSFAGRGHGLVALQHYGLLRDPQAMHAAHWAM